MSFSLFLRSIGFATLLDSSLVACVGTESLGIVGSGPPVQCQLSEGLRFLESFPKGFGFYGSYQRD